MLMESRLKSECKPEEKMVGTLDRFNNAKRAEEHDRVKHA